MSEDVSTDAAPPARSRTGVRGLGFQVWTVDGEKRLYATAQWSDESGQTRRMRSISSRGIPRAAQQIAEVLAASHPHYEDAGDLTETCEEALTETIMQIYRSGEYPSDNGPDDGTRYEAVRQFVESSPFLKRHFL